MKLRDGCFSSVIYVSGVGRKGGYSLGHRIPLIPTLAQAFSSWGGDRVMFWLKPAFLSIRTYRWDGAQGSWGPGEPIQVVGAGP